MNFDIICIGSALLDVYMKSSAFKRIPAGEFEGGVALCEEFGGKTEVDEVEVCSGGAGTNNAVSFARKGLRVALVAEMGTDLVAATIKEELVREGVDVSMLVEEAEEETGISKISVASDGGRSVAVYRGASKMLTKADIQWEQLEADWLYISSLGGEMDLLEGLIGHAKAYGIRVAVNPGKAEIQRLATSGQWSVFDGVEVLIMNREEAAELSGLAMEDEVVWRGDERFCGAKNCVVTDGRNGGKVYEADRVWFYEVASVKAVEETGAGDGFGSGLVYGLMSGKSVVEAVEVGKKQAASVVQFMGAKRGLLRLDEIE